MKGRIVRFGKILGGGAFLVLGVIGLFLPFLQGILFLIIGLTLLSTESEHARRCLGWLKKWVRRAKKQGVNDDG